MRLTFEKIEGLEGLTPCIDGHVLWEASRHHFLRTGEVAALLYLNLMRELNGPAKACRVERWVNDREQFLDDVLLAHQMGER
jgi:hypothetical protein